MKSILTILITVLSFGAFAQSKPAATSGGDCFKQWYTVFKERGASAIPDGTQDVIITLRSSDYSECFVGRIDVAGGKLAGKLQIQKVDGSFEEFDKKVSSTYQSEGTLKEELRDINNGMSASLTLTDGEIIRLFFPKYLAAKPKANKKAPPVSTVNK